MSFNPSPTGYFPNIITSSSGVFIPYTDFESYKISTSGDIRQLAYSFLSAVAEVYSNLPSSGQSSNMTVSRTWAAQSNTVLRKTYNFSFNLAFSGVSVSVD
jgi:hypothetical protein